MGSQKYKDKIKQAKKGFPVEPQERFDRLDALRGVAIVWMTLFHFCFDLNYFGFLNFNFYEDPLWTWQRTCIVTLFLFCAGSGQAVAQTKALRWSRFFKRWSQVVGASALVTVGSYVVYPKSFIYFGILHAIAVMLLIVRSTLRWSFLYWVIGPALIGLLFLAPSVHQQNPQLEFLNEPLMNWLGFISRKPITEDYVPLIPWLGVLMLGYALGQWVLKNRTHWFSGELKSNFRWLAVLGRWSLSYYLIHQPVLFGFVFLLRKIIGS